MAAQLTPVAAFMLLAQLLAPRLSCEFMLSATHSAGGPWRPASAAQET
jgi:hypothetical protein